MANQFTNEIKEGLLGSVELVIGIFPDVERPPFNANPLRQDLVYIHQSVLGEIGRD